MSKPQTCVHCGAPLPEGANFCPACAKSQLPPAYITPPTGRRRLALRISAILALLAIAAALLLGSLPYLTALLNPGPQVYESQAAELDYTLDGAAYRLLLTFAGGSNPTPQPENSAQIRAGEIFANPSQLYILPADGGDAEAFLAAVTDCTVETIPLDGAAAMEHTPPLPDDIFVDAALVSHVSFDTTCGANDVVWTLTLENGDIIRLRQRITVTEVPEVTYTAADADLTTAAALEAFVASLDETLEPGTLIELQLPAVIYTEPVNLGSRAVNLYGTSVGETRTTFTESVTAYPSEGSHMTVHGIVFDGRGGTGLSAATGVSLEACTFTGWDVGVEALDGGWVGAHSCTFEENGVGIFFDTTNSQTSSHAYEDNRFLRNGTALELRRMPGEETLTFAGSVFSGNAINVDNQTIHPLDFSDTVVE